MSLIGASFENYVILREIAKGALSRVYLASDGKLVKAVKVFPEAQHRRATHEFELARALEHPHLGSVEAEVEVAGQPGLLMRYVPGVRLIDWLAEQRITEPFLDCFTGVLEALGYLHERGIVHRDVKPENILVKEARATLLDFDLAVLEPTPRRRGFAGTIAYLSPEEARGEAATRESDLYAAGVILYRALTGQVPFTGSVAEVMAAHRQVIPERPSSFAESLRPYDLFFAKLLAKEPEERYRSAAEVTAELQRIRKVTGALPLPG